MGLYTVSLSWTVLSLTHDAASVGIFYLSASASSLLASPLAGLLLANPRHRHHRQRIILAAGAVRSFALLIPSMLQNLDLAAADRKTFILAVAVLFGPANSLYGAVSEGWLLDTTPAPARHRIARRVGLIRQVAFCAGLALAGFSIMKTSAETTSALAAILGMAGVLACLFPVRPHARSKDEPMSPWSRPAPSFLLRTTAGMMLIRTMPALIFPCFVATLAFSVSQMANASLAPIMVAHMKPAATLGLVASSWGAGAIGAAMLANICPTLPTGSRSSYLFFLSVLGVSCVTFSATESTPAQMILFAGMGGIFSWLRIGTQAEIALHTPAERIAVVQLALSNLVSVTAVAIYLLPSLLNRFPPGGIFALWGAVVVVVAAGVWIGLHLGAKRLTAPTHSPAPTPPDR